MLGFVDIRSVGLPITSQNTKSALACPRVCSRGMFRQAPAAGPFGVTDRYDGARTAAGLEGGAFERPIGVYRMAYSCAAG